MVNFRRIILALAVVALFAGMASADTGSGPGGQMSCATNVGVTPALRGEGYTEQSGDLTITCTGGATPTPGALITAVNFTVFYTTTVTSRLIGNASEALLLIDEPGSGVLTGDGPLRPQILCTTPLSGCQAYVNTAAQPNTLGGNALVPWMTTGTTGAGSPAPNVYQGIVSGNSVTFLGVPVMPPTTTGTRVFRITNVRVNANQNFGGSAAGGQPISAAISISPATALAISNSTQPVGYVSAGLKGTTSANLALTQCNSYKSTQVATLNFAEQFATAFKTRVNASNPTTQNTAYAGQNVPANANLAGVNPPLPQPNQSTPGAIYNSESNFLFNVGSAGTPVYAGLADYGTRLKATFNNIPTGATLLVSLTNGPAPAVVGGSVANGNIGGTSYAQLVSVGSSDGVSDGTSGFFPAVQPDTAGGNVATVPLSNGSGSAEWEVVNTNPNATETFSFGVYITYAANTGAPPPAATVNMSFGPVYASGAASSSLPIPRFTGDTATARSLFTVAVCRTVLLYPYVLHQIGLDTGLSIANTTTDPFKTVAQANNCKLNWYGTAAPATATDTGTIGSGTVWTGAASNLAPGFQGYMIAVCNFQLAHGFAFISDLGIRNVAMGYLAVVLNDPTDTGSRAPGTITTLAEVGGN